VWTLPENELRVLSRAPVLSGLRDGRDEFGETATFLDLLGWLTNLIQLPVAGWRAVRSVQ
jgi:hypothetical protein